MEFAVEATDRAAAVEAGADDEGATVTVGAVAAAVVVVVVVAAAAAGCVELELEAPRHDKARDRSRASLTAVM